MQKSEPYQPSGVQPAQVIPIVRGLLATPTGDPDVPWEPVVLKSIASKEALAFAGDQANAKGSHYPKPLTKGPKPPLFVTVPEQAVEPDAMRKQMQETIARFAAQHGGKPDIVCLRDLGILYIDHGQDGADLPLRNKVALVTGAAGAIGYGVCRGLLEKGCHVAATDLAGEKLDRFVADLSPMAPDRIIPVALDVTSKESVAAGFEAVIRTWGGIDLVVVNAGIAMVSALKEIDLEAFRKLEKVNVEGALLTLSATAHHFIGQGTGGDVVIISTKNVPSPGAGFGAYSATKAACHQLGRIASIELAPHGVRVNMVAPDAVFSEGKFKSGLWEEVGPDRMRARGLDEEGLQEYYRSRNLLKARVTGRHVANAVLFFATRQTPTTGATIPVDGGLPDATPR
ncbi:MAG: SDR family NAD(P)-dependent oxidoreductase [Phycisphaerae bacterium]|nr:SDR family NAD(P)-dependent oxidoreductase [Phycisphaerae bacterium]